MTTLVFASRVGPTEGAILSSCRAAGDEAVFFDTTSRELVGSDRLETPSWLGAPFFPDHHPLVAAHFGRLSAELGVDRVVAVGLDASAFALQVLPDHSVLPLLFRGDLDFSSARVGHVRQFARVNRTARLLVLEDPWEMDKAAGHGSVLPHIRLPSSVLPGERVLRRSGQPRVAVLVEGGAAPEQQPLRVQDLLRTLTEVGAHPSLVDIRTLYGRRDLAMGRGFIGTMRYRIGDFSHAVILGDSPHTWAVFNGLSSDLDRVYVEDTVNSHHLYPNAWRHAARGAALADRVRAGILTGVGDVPAWPAPSRPGGASGWTAQLDAARDAELPWCYEEDPRLQDGYFDVFFSVAPIENRTNGARPQRIRNMAEAFADEAAVIRLSPHPHVLRRRRAWMERLEQEGIGPRFFYGESSTSPMASTATIEAVAGCVRDLTRAGCRAGWFVRDLHWLSPQAEHLDPTSAEGRALIRRGRHELRQLAEVTDVFFAPCASAIAGFQDLLDEELFRRSVTWVPLPPAVNVRNLLQHPPPGPEREGLTLVYSGGVGGFYNLQPYLRAVAGLTDEVWLDFVVRQEDQSRLHEVLASHGLGVEHGAVTVRVGSFADYVPRTDRAVSVALLDGDYGRLSFPYKVMSSLEHRMPVLAFAGTDYGAFVSREGLGYSCGPDPQSIRAAVLEALSDRRPTESLVPSATLERHTWEARVRTVRASLVARAAAAPELWSVDAGAKTSH